MDPSDRLTSSSQLAPAPTPGKTPGHLNGDETPSNRPKLWWCDNCDGTGWVEGGEVIQTECPNCHGSGVVEMYSNG
jgi:hypothetical protein